MRNAAVPESTFSILTVIDAHSAVISRYTFNALMHIRTIVAPSPPSGTSDHMGDTPRRSYHAGTRGETASAARQRARLQLRRQFIADVADAVAGVAAPAEWIVIGGTSRDARALAKALIAAGLHHAIIAAPVSRGLPAKAVLERIADAIAVNRDSRDFADVETLLEHTGAHTTGVVGAVASMDAAERGAAGAILMTRRYQDEHPVAADRLSAAARAHKARIVTVASAAADLLDVRGGGVGALLRYSACKPPTD